MGRSEKRAALANEKRAERGKAANQFPNGAQIAKVDELRRISSPSSPASQAVFIYDDGFASNPQHAVIRLSDSLPEEEVALVLDDLRAAFNKRVEPR